MPEMPQAPVTQSVINQMINGKPRDGAVDIGEWITRKGEIVAHILERRMTERQAFDYLEALASTPFGGSPVEEDFRADLEEEESEAIKLPSDFPLEPYLLGEKSRTLTPSEVATINHLKSNSHAVSHMISTAEILCRYSDRPQNYNLALSLICAASKKQLPNVIAGLTEILAEVKSDFPPKLFGALVTLLDSNDDEHNPLPILPSMKSIKEFMLNHPTLSTSNDEILAQFVLMSKVYADGTFQILRTFLYAFGPEIDAKFADHLKALIPEETDGTPALLRTLCYFVEKFGKPAAESGLMESTARELASVIFAIPDYEFDIEGQVFGVFGKSDTITEFFEKLECLNRKLKEIIRDDAPDRVVSEQLY